MDSQSGHRAAALEIIPWNDAFRTGFAEIDVQHQGLVAILNRLATHLAYPSESFAIANLLADLQSYTEQHFQTEERLWARYLADDLAEVQHRSLHAGFVHFVEDLRARQQTLAEDQVVLEALSYLTHWLVAHILESDRYMALTVQYLQSGVSLEQSRSQAEALMRKEHRRLIELVLAVYGSLTKNSIDLIRSITDQRVLLQTLKNREQYVQTLLEVLPVPILICDADYQAVRANSAFVQTFVAVEEVVFLQMRMALSASTTSSLDHWPDALRQCMTSNLLTSSTEVLIHCPDGREKTILLRAVVLDHADARQYLLTLYDVSDRKQMEQALERERAFLRTLIHTLPDLIWLKNREGVYLACNPAFERFFGASEANIVGKSDADFVDEALADSFRKHDLFAMTSDQSVRNEEWITLAEDGRRILLETTKTPMRDLNGDVLGVLGIGHDVTERYQQEQALRDSEARFHALYSSMTEGVALHEMIYQDDGSPCDYRFLSVNSAFERHTGLQQTAILSKRASEVFGQVPYLQDYARVVETGNSLYFEDRFEPMQKVFAITAVRPAQGHFATIFRDISRQVELESALRQTSEQLRAVLQSTPVPMILLDAADQLTYVNQSFQSLFGYGLEKVKTVEQWLALSLPHEPERRAVQQLWQLGSQTVQAEPQALRMQTEAGHERSIIVHLSWLQAETALTRPIRLLTLVDLTDQQLQHDEILSLKDRLESTLDALPDIIFEVDAEGVFQTWHAPVDNVLGVGSSDAVGSMIAEVLPKEAARLCSEVLQEAMQHGISSAIPFLVDTPTKRAWLTISALRKKHGSAMAPGVVVIIRDITDRMRSEAMMELRQTLGELVFSHELHPLLMKALTEVERLTESPVSFYHRLDRSGVHVEDYVWSLNTLQMVQLQPEVESFENTTVWDECIALRQTIVLNQQAGILYKQEGLPGTVTLSRLVVVPVFREDHLVAVLGVANRRSAYDRQAVAMVAHLAELIQDIVERQQAEKRIKQMAFSDALTGLPNRQLFRDRLQQAVAFGKRSNRQLAVCYFDLDGFKPVNDHFGHGAGDQLLIKLANRLQHELREGDTLARMGGDEFVFLLHGLENVFSGEKIIRRFLHAISHPFDIEGHHIQISASMGVTYYPLDPSHPDMLIRHADQAMYQAKQSGKNAFCLYEGLESKQNSSLSQALEEFELALEHGELILYYQPRIELASGVPVGVEALVRWHHPERGVLDPAEFFPLILDHALEFQLDCWVLEQACGQLMDWHARDLDLFMSVNINARHLRDPGFPETLARILADCPREVCQKLELEVTEVAALGDAEHVARCMRQCLDLGVRFALDDFGAGYTSLTSLYRLPFALLKIDQNRVRDMLDDQQDQDVVEGILRLAASLNVSVVAEGVESIEHGFMLTALGCPFAQGFAIAHPMPAESLTKWQSSWQMQRHWPGLHTARKLQNMAYDIEVAMYSHRLWMEQVRALAVGSGEQNPVVMDAPGCQLSRWLDGIGLARYGQRSSFVDVIAGHQDVHQKARLYIDAVQSRAEVGAEALLAAVEASSHRLLATLQQLAQE